MDRAGAGPTGADPTGADPTGADPTGADPTGAGPSPHSPAAEAQGLSRVLHLMNPQDFSSLKGSTRSSPEATGAAGALGQRWQGARRDCGGLCRDTGLWGLCGDTAGTRSRLRVPLGIFRDSVTRHQQRTGDEAPTSPGTAGGARAGAEGAEAAPARSRLSRQRRGRPPNRWGRSGCAAARPIGWRCLGTFSRRRSALGYVPWRPLRFRFRSVPFPVPAVGQHRAGLRRGRYGRHGREPHAQDRERVQPDAEPGAPRAAGEAAVAGRVRRAAAAAGARVPSAAAALRRRPGPHRAHLLPGGFRASAVNQKVICECKKATLQSRFVEKYNELKEEGKIEEEKLFEETGKALLASGIVLQRRGVDKVAQQEQQGAGSRAPALQLQLQTVLEELQEKRKDGKEQPPELAGAQKENPCPS
ncbi:28S ribosomal protein S23, mitochondrial isoform X1 [Parus major]|uniref:28S ribosomal protein S23, mitochondrial isoform X1 n=1 Tax=Parus major TaxID=9157 RepID=UPI0014444DA1|nr:28S ribosomal protein S23, mitochondrial isoform X1 [Parus major]